MVRPRVSLCVAFLAAALALLLVVPALAGAAPATTVSLTFDDGLANQYANALPALSAHGMHGTFFVNTAHLENNAEYMTWSQLQALAAAGNEVGGHTLDHANLTTLEAAEAAREVCNDRVNLINHGLAPTDFAYPYGAFNASLESTVKGCGYNSGRALGGVVSPFDGACSSGCPFAESIPAADPYAIRTPDSVTSSTTLADLETLVTQAESHGGGWVPIVFHDVCANACQLRSISPTLFGEFLDWLAGQASSGEVSVQTVREVIGGAVQEGVAGPPPTGPSLQNASLENADAEGMPSCWQPGGFGTNSPAYTRSANAHAGSWAEQLSVSGYQSGDAKLLVRQDQGQCSPSVTAGRAYTVSTWYQSTTGMNLIAFYRDQVGAWHYLATSPAFPSASGWTEARWTTPAMPSDATAISFGPALTSNGSITIDDLGLAMAPPTVHIVGLSGGTTYSGLNALGAEAGSGTDHVDFLVNGNVVGTAHSAPWTVPWSSQSVSSGPVTITARAVDAGGASSSASVNVSIDNSGSLVKNSSLEWETGNNSLPDCWQQGGFGTNSFRWTRTSDAHSGSWAERVEISSYTSGDRKLLQTQDSGQCAPAVVPGREYTLSGWFKSSIRPFFVVFVRNGSGQWSFWTSSPAFNGSTSSWTQASWRTPPVPSGTTNISYGLNLASVGFVTVDDFGLSCGVGCDTTAPSSHASAPALAGSGSVSVSYTAADEGGAGLERVDLYAKAPGAASYSKVASDASGAGSGSFSYTPAAGDGTYSFYTLATDKAGNAQPVPASPDASTLVDTTAPSSHASAPALSGSGSVSVSYTASDGEGSGLERVDLYAKAPGQSVYSKVASDTSGAGSGGFSYTPAAGDGTYSFYTVATDKAGNAQTAPASPDASTVVDTAAPSAHASAPALSGSASVTVSYTAADGEGGSGVERVDLYAKAPGQSSYSKVASDASGAGSGSFSYTPAAGDGTYSFYTVATDKAGNAQAAPASPDASTLVDTTAPSSHASAPALSGSGSVSVSYTASDGEGSGLERVDLYARAPGAASYSKVASDASGAGSGSFSYTPAAGDGTYSFYTVAADKAGNAQAAPASPDASTVVDATAPSSHASAPALSGSGSLSVSYTAADEGGSGLERVDLYAKAPGQSVYSKVASDTSGAGSGSFSYTPAAGDGTYSFFTVATDKAGNAQAAPASPDASTVVDATAPSSHASAPALSGSGTVSVSYTASGGEGSGLERVDLYAKAPGQSVYSKVASDASGAGSGGFSYTPAAGDGTYSFYTLATDKAGNAQAAPASPDASTLVDTTAPSSHASAPALSGSGTVSVSYTASDGEGSGLERVDLYAKAPGAAVYSKVASDTSGAGSGGFSYTPAAGAGTYSFYTVATDKAGNAQAAPASPDASTLVDTAAPSSHASAPALSGSGTVSVSYTAADEGGAGLEKVDLYAKAPGQSSYSKVASDTSGAGSGSFSYSAAGGDGTYSFYTVATDKAGNTQAAPASPDASTLVDTTAPSSQASAPALVGYAPIVVSYTASDGEGSGVASVDLYARAPGAASYSKVASDTSGAGSGSFSYTPAAGNGTYSFYTVATDKAGAAEAAPATADASTNYTKDITPPTSGATAPAYANASTWTVAYTASDNGGADELTSVELWVRVPGAKTYVKAAVNSGAATSGSFSYTAAAGEGSYAFYTIAVDQSGNRQAVPAAANATTMLDMVAPSAFTMTEPAPFLRGNVKLSLASAPTDARSGVASVTYLYRPNGGGQAWSTACKATVSPWTCTWSTATPASPDGVYELQAVAADRAGNTTQASNTPFTGITVENAQPRAVSVATANGGSLPGRAETGDSVTFTYSAQMKPSSILEGWSGANTPVQVRLVAKSTTDTVLTVWNAANTTQLALASPLDLGAAYVPKGGAVFNATMVQSGAAITVTLGSQASGGVLATPVSKGTLTWTPSAKATDLAGNKCTTTAVTAPGPAF